ncbi:hypothetical protein JCM10296v2_001299 [Rhodotorula toruloides]
MSDNVSGTGGDVDGLLAPQAVAREVLAPYVTGLVTSVLLIGIFFALFARYARHDLKEHGIRGRAVSWTVCILLVMCLGVSYEEIVDTGVSQLRSSEELYAGPPQSNILPILSGLTEAVCQAFLLVRTGALMENVIHRYVFYGLTGLVILGGLLGSVLYSSMGFLLIKNVDTPIPPTVCQALWLWMSAGADIFISVALAYTLHRRITNLGGFNATTEGLVKKLITIALQTAAYTSIMSLIGASLSTAYAHSTDFHTISIGQAFWLPLPALHGISLYTTLSIRKTIASTLSNSRENDSLNPTLPRSGYSRNAGDAAGGAVKLSTFRVGDRRSHQHTLPTTTQTGTLGGVQVPLEVKVQQTQQISFDMRDEFDEEYSLEGKLKESL